MKLERGTNNKESRWYQVFLNDDTMFLTQRETEIAETAYQMGFSATVKENLTVQLSPISDWKKHWSNDPDRIAYYENELTSAGLPSIDEMVIHDANVHLEKLSDSGFYMIAENDNHYWHFQIYSRSGRAKIEAQVYEKEDKLAADRKATAPSTEGR